MVSVVGFLVMVSVVVFVVISVVAGKRLFMVSVAGLLVDSAAAGGSNISECIERFLVVCVFRTGFRRWFLSWFPLRLFMVSVTCFYIWFPSWQENVCFYCFRRCFVVWFPSWQGTLFNGFRRFVVYGFRLLQDRGFLSDGNRKTKQQQDVSVTN